MRRILVVFIACATFPLSACGIARQQYYTHLQTLDATKNEAHQECLRLLMTHEYNTVSEATNCEKKAVLAKANEIQFYDSKVYADYYDRLLKIDDDFDNQRITLAQADQLMQMINANFNEWLTAKIKSMQAEEIRDAAIASAMGNAMQQQSQMYQQRAIAAQQAASTNSAYMPQQSPPSYFCQRNGNSTTCNPY